MKKKGGKSWNGSTEGKGKRDGGRGKRRRLGRKVNGANVCGKKNLEEGINFGTFRRGKKKHAGGNEKKQEEMRLKPSERKGHRARWNNGICLQRGKEDHRGREKAGRQKPREIKWNKANNSVRRPLKGTAKTERGDKVRGKTKAEGAIPPTESIEVSTEEKRGMHQKGPKK